MLIGRGGVGRGLCGLTVGMRPPPVIFDASRCSGVGCASVPGGPSGGWRWKQLLFTGHLRSLASFEYRSSGLGGYNGEYRKGYGLTLFRSLGPLRCFLAGSFGLRSCTGLSI